MSTAPTRPHGFTSPATRPLAARSHRSAWWACAVCFALVMAALGVLRPTVALAAALITAVGLACVGLAYMLLGLLGRIGRAERSEFAPAVYERPPQVLPHHIARIAPAPGEKRPPLSSGARTGIVTVATERLWARHGLNLHDPTHHDAVERRVTASLWAVIRPDRLDHRGQPVRSTSVMHRDLDRLLDDLESI